MMQRLCTILVLSLLTLSIMWPSEAAIDGEGLHLAAGWHIVAAMCIVTFRHRVSLLRFLTSGSFVGLLLLVAGFWLSTWHVFQIEGDRRAALNLSLHWLSLPAAT